MLFRVERNSIGDASVPNGVKEWNEITCKADCGCELSANDKLYRHEDKLVCEDCLLELAYAGKVIDVYADEEESAEADYWDRRYDEMRDERGNT